MPTEDLHAHQLLQAADVVTPMAVRVAATLRLADHVAAGADTPADLEAATGVDAGRLDRLLRRLVTAGLVTRSEDGRYALTPVGDALRSDAEGSRLPWLDLEGPLGRSYLSMVQLLHSIRTGRSGYVEQFGRTIWQDLSDDPELFRAFDAVMAQNTGSDMGDFLHAYDWTALGTVVDCGGGSGTLLAALLQANPGLRGTVFDLPGPASRAAERFAAEGLADRASTVAGSFFDGLPPGEGGYLFSHVLHDWSDEDAVRILGQAAAAAGSDGRVLVLEWMDPEAALNSQMDLLMLTVAGGRERTPDGYAELGARVGLRLGKVVPGGHRTLVELLPE